MTRIALEPLEKTSLADWFETDAGRYVLDWEHAQIDRAVEDVFGFNAAQIGMPGVDYLRANRMPHRFIVGEAGSTLQASPSHLPLQSHSLDLLVLPHVLEFCADPHQVLREAERVLMPEGQIVIAGFNPLSLWGLTRLSRRRLTTYPWRGEFIGLLRLRDWLKLLGFELNGGKFGCYAPAFVQERWLQRFRFMEKAGDRWWPIAGAVYVVRAVKRTAGIRLVAPPWRVQRREARALVSVASRSGANRSFRLIRGSAMDGLTSGVPQPPVLRPVPDPEPGERDGG